MNSSKPVELPRKSTPPRLVGLEPTLLPQPSLEIQQLGVHGPQALDIGTIPIAPKPPNHNAQLRHHVHQRAAQQRKRRARRVTRGVLKMLAHFLEVELVASETEGALVPLFRVLEGFCGEPTNVGGGDVLHLFRFADGVAQGGEEDFRGEPWDEVVHEGDGAEDRPAHGCVGGRVAQVVLDVVFSLEVRDGCLVCPRFLIAAALDAAVDEVANTGFDAFVDEVVALFDLAVGGHALAHGDLDGVDAEDLLAAGDLVGSFEEGGHVVEVALDEFHRGGFGGQLLGAAAVCVTGYGEEGEVAGGGGVE